MAESEGVLDQDTAAARQLALAARRREVEGQYRCAMARSDADEPELDAEVEHEAQFQQTLNHLVSFKAKVVGRRGKVRTVVVLQALMLRLYTLRNYL